MSVSKLIARRAGSKGEVSNILYALTNIVDVTCTDQPRPLHQRSQESLYGKKVIVADRDMVETESDAILQNADTEDVAFLVVGDPFG